MRRLAAVWMTTCVALLAIASASMAAPPATPAWSIAVVPIPSAFEAPSTYDSKRAMPGYQVSAYNIGGEDATGGFTITDTLPPGVLPAPGFPPSGIYGRPLLKGAGRNLLTCSVLGRKVTCTGGVVESVHPGESVSLTIPVEVEIKASGSVVDKASIEGGGAAVATTAQPTPISAQPSPFGFLPGPVGLYGLTTEADGSAANQAGSHPYQMTVAGLSLTTNKNDLSPLLAAGGGLRDATVALPKGVVIDPAATPRCKESELESELEGAGCPRSSQVGTIALAVSLAGGLGVGEISPLYNMVPPPGYPAALAFEVVGGAYVHLLGSVSSDGSFTLTAASRDVLSRVAIGVIRTTLWGVPSDSSHDFQRGECLYESRKESTCGTERTGRPFVTLPSSCGGPLTTGVSVDDWLQPGVFVHGEYQSVDREGNPVGVDGCNALDFAPTIDARPTTGQGDSPSGLDFHLHIPQHEGAEELATANLRDATVQLPEGLAVNPSAGSGLEGCSSAQIGLTSAVGASPVRFVEGPTHCPDASKLGTGEAISPVLVDEPTTGTQLPHVLKGAVYLAKPFDNPFGSLLALYFVIEDESTGIIAKLAGRAEPNPTTGQLTATFAENPELPLEDVTLHLFGGPRGSITTPISCGGHTTASTLVPWSTPEGATAHPTDTFQTTGSCSPSEAAAPKSFSFEAGTVTPLAGAYSPFVLKLTRPDGSQRLTGLDLTLPPGLTGKLAGIPYCPDAAIARAQARSNPEEGKLEQADPSCPAASEVGTATVGAGSGPDPIYVTGHAYLAGPYKGAPLSMVIVTPAVAGPFDLGVVVVRVALQVNPETAQIYAVSDPLPTILDGIPLDVRSIDLDLGRPGFTLNPTSCEAKSIEGRVGTQPGQSASLANRFQVGECARLSFKPKLSITLKGSTKRTGHPALKALLTYPKGGAYANVARAQVNLPHSEFIEQNNLNKTCTRPVLLEGKCPKTTIYGKAKAWTPLLEKPLAGNVYLVGGFGYKLPALVAELDGQIRVLLKGKVDSGPNGGIRNTFEAVPDAPVEKFALELKGGPKYSLLVNSENLCKKPQRAIARFTAQDGKVLQTKPVIANSCKKGKKTGGKQGGNGGGKKSNKKHK